MKYLSKEPIYSKTLSPDGEATWERVFGKKGWEITVPHEKICEDHVELVQK